MIDIVFQILQTAGYLLLLPVLIVLWGKVFRQKDWRKFWMFLALAWTMNLLGNIAWIIHDLVTETPLSTFSIVDSFYVLRYVLIGIALWLYPTSLHGKSAIWMGVAALVTGVLVWIIYFPVESGDLVSLFGLVIYPILDAALIALAWFRFHVMRGTAWHKLTLILFCAMASYGIANTVNLTEYVFSMPSGGWLQNLFWLLTDVLLMTMALRTDLRRATQK
jgi:hypothetical protein